MLKKLRNKMLLLNMVVISALLIAAFSFILAKTYSDVQHEIHTRLNMTLSDASHNRQKNENKPRNNLENPPPAPAANPENRPNEKLGEKPSEAPDFSPSFSIELDADGNILKINAMFSLESEFAQSLLSAAGAQVANEGKLHMDGSSWYYKKEGNITAFTDASQQLSTVLNLAVTLSIVAVIALAAVFFISLIVANRSIAPVEDAWNKQNMFIADASHELKTPLTTINTNIDVLMSQPDSTIREGEKWLSYIKNESERMTRLTNDLLYLTRMDSDSSEMIYEPISFSDAAEKVILPMEAMVFERNICLNYTIAPNIMVLANPQQLQQLTAILLDNAVKYTPKSGYITINLKKEKQNAVLTVENSGDGIAKDDIDHVFDRFYRTDKSRARESGGHGLGLAIAKSIVAACKGKIHAESQPGLWTKFIIEIPLSS